MFNRRSALIWIALTLLIAVPVGFAATSSLLQYRQPIYIVAGFAGVIAMGLLLLQPLFASRYLPNLTARQASRLHRVTGSALLLLVVVHVGALWLTSPPDVVDALLFASPTPFSLWGVIAMWGIFIVAFLVAFKSKLKLRPRHWLIIHRVLVSAVVFGSVLHAMLIDGTMETISKGVLCFAALIVTVAAVAQIRLWGSAKKLAKRT